MASSKTNILLVGSGGREHAFAWKLSQSPLVGKLYVAPGNGGTTHYNVPISSSDIESLVKFAKEKDCFTIIGPEGPLAEGLVDALDQVGLKSFGPTKSQARIETSKSFAKELMKSINIPTANFQIFKDYNSALEYCNRRESNVVIKADGLAGGKGVFVCSGPADVENALKMIFSERIFGDSGNSVVIEEKLSGYEISLMTICDGQSAMPFGTAIDHKRLLDGDKGPNTGGMGAFSPAQGFDEHRLEDVMEKIVRPIVRKTRFKGFLYVGLMVTNEGPKVLEFNARLGDPEAQVILPRLKSDLAQTVMRLCKEGTRGEFDDLTWDTSFACTVVMCSRGYPFAPKTGFRILGVEEVERLGDVLIFHCGTKTSEEGDLVTNGGRVLSITARGDTLTQACDSAYSAVKLISWEGEFHRNDIGRCRVT
jgi:phosphoribosylamine--glycine ligase